MRSDPTLTRRLLLGHGFGAALLLPTGAAGAKRVPAGGHLARRPRPTAPLVVIDPGHGGKDPGAIGVSGLYEKHVALLLAQALQAQLLVGQRCRVRLTRETDTFLPLAGRVALAQSWGATLFVSVHADAVGNPGVRGASVYTLASHPSDPQTAALAERENSADAAGRLGIRGGSPEVDEILVSLVRRETQTGSARVQHHILAGLEEKVPLLENPARHAAFAVLQAADIPSVLVESGFMSNRLDEIALSDPRHRILVATAIRHGIEAFLA